MSLKEYHEGPPSCAGFKCPQGTHCVLRESFCAEPPCKLLRSCIKNKGAVFNNCNNTFSKTFKHFIVIFFSQKCKFGLENVVLLVANQNMNAFYEDLRTIVQIHHANTLQIASLKRVKFFLESFEFLQFLVRN